MERNTSATAPLDHLVPADKTVPMRFRFTPTFKTLLFAYCKQHGIEVEAVVAKSPGEKIE